MTGFQAAGEASSTSKRASSTSKQAISSLFFYFLWVSLAFVDPDPNHTDHNTYLFLSQIKNNAVPRTENALHMI